MTDTIISSATKEVIIGFNRPFTVIREVLTLLAASC